MKHKRHFLGTLLVASVLVVSCTQDFIEKNISGQSVQLMAPGNGISTSVATQTFWWNTVSGAEQYDLQIVQGTFSSAIQLVLDTLVTNNKFTHTLLPGSYQWRVKATNNGYSTPYTTYSLKIDTNTNMSTQILVLVAPTNNFWSNTLANTFKWDSIVGATSYRLQIINQSNSTIVIDTTVKREPITLTVADGKYTWQVRAQNASTNSPYALYTLGVDTTTPKVPVQITPRNDSIFTTDRFTLNWSVSSGSLSPITTTLYIYSNPSMSTIIKDTVTSLTSYPDTLATGTYYWRLQSVNAAGNKSGYSTLFSFSTP